jgi:transcriptional regulator with XRE-family HTH domain
VHRYGSGCLLDGGIRGRLSAKLPGGAVSVVLAPLLAIASTLWLTKDVGPVNVGSIGEYIRQQREQAKISLRQLASAAGVSNPYLSQIERGLRHPSAEILQQIAKGLRISAEALYVQAGILEDRRPDSGVRAAVLADPELAERQKQVLLEIYESFRRETALNAPADTGAEAAALSPGPGAAGVVPRGASPQGASADGEFTDLGSIAPGSTGIGSTGDGSTGDGTNQESSGAEAPAHNPSRPARSGQGE